MVEILYGDSQSLAHVIKRLDAHDRRWYEQYGVAGDILPTIESMMIERFGSDFVESIFNDGGSFFSSDEFNVFSMKTPLYCRIGDDAVVYGVTRLYPLEIKRLLRDRFLRSEKDALESSSVDASKKKQRRI